MNQLGKVIFSVLAASTVSYGAITNYVNNGITDPDQLSSADYIGTTGQNAATISAISDLLVTNATFTGGSGLDGVSANNLTSVAGAGVKISNVDLAEIEQVTAEKIQGGSGATISITTDGIRTGVANGGDAVRFSGTSAQQLLINDGYLVGGVGGNASGNSGNTIQANGGSAVYADTGTVNVKAGLFVGGEGGGVAGPSAGRLTAKGGSGIDVNISTAVIETLDAGVVATGGKGGLADESTALVSDTTGGNGLNLRWNLGSFGANTITVNGGSYTGGAGGTSAGVDSVADGGSGMLMAGGQSILISEGTFTGGIGGVATGQTARADGGIGAKLWFANAAAGGSLQITGGTFNGGAAGIANGVQGEEGYGLFLTASSSELSDITVTGRGLLVNATGLPTETTIKNGTFSRATFTSFIPPEFIAAVPMMNVFTIEDSTFGEIMVEGVAGSDGTIYNGIAEDFILQGAGVNTIKLGGAFAFQDLYLGGTANNILSISNGVTSAGNVVVQGGVSTINLWSDEHFSDTSISNGTINFNNHDFNMLDGSVFALHSQNAEANFERDVVVNGSLDVGMGSFNVGSNLMVKAGSDLRTTLAADGTGVKGGEINVQTAEFQDGVSWTLDNADNLDATHFENDILLVSASVSNGIIGADFFDAEDFTLSNNPIWTKGINGVTNKYEAGYENLYATYGTLDLDVIFEGYDPELVKAMAGLQNAVANDPALSAYIGTNWTSLADALPDFEESFVRTPEMANALIGLQGVFAEQIKGRTRSNLRHKNFGSKTTYAPAGARGPADWYDNSVQWTKDHLPSWDVKSASRKISENAPIPNIEGDPSEVGKPYNSSTAGKSSDYAAVQSELRNRTPAPSGEYDAVQNELRNRTPALSGEAIELPETYQVWGRAYGSHVNQDSTTGHTGYDASIVGGVVGIDKRFEKMLIGLGAGYARTALNGNGGNDGEADTVYAVGYFSHNSESLYFDASLSYAFNDVETKGSSSFGYEGEYDANTAGFALGTGYGISFCKDRFLFTPEASYLGTYFSRGSYKETSNLAFADKDYESYDQWSHLTSIGATLSMIGVIESFNTELEFQPEIRAHWLHEFNADADNDSYRMAGGNGNPIAVALQAREEDLIRLGAGVRFSEWKNDTTEFGLDIDGTIGSDYQNFIVSGKIIHRF